MNERHRGRVYARRTYLHDDTHPLSQRRDLLVKDSLLILCGETSLFEYGEIMFKGFDAIFVAGL